MTASPLILATLLHLCLSVTGAESEQPCMSTTQLPSAGFFLPGAFTPSGEMRYSEDDFPLRVVYVGDPPEGLSVQDVERAVSGAIETWNAVPCSRALMRYEGHVATLEDVSAQHYPVIHLNEEESPCLMAGVTSRIGAAPCFVGAASLPGAVFNRDGMRWYSIEREGRVLREEQGTLPLIDFRAALTHELGHLLGLNHPARDAYTPRASMFASYRVDGGQAALAATDRAHLCALYPDEAVGTQTCGTDERCARALGDPGARCVTLEPWQVCDKASGAQGDYCADNMLYCDDICLITSTTTQTGYCTTRCEDDEECGEGWFCNPNGLSAPGPESASICQALAPGEPPERGCSVTGPGAPAWPTLLWAVGLAIGVWSRKRAGKTRQV